MSWMGLPFPRGNRVSAWTVHKTLVPARGNSELSRTGLMTPPGITCFNEVFQISLEWGLFFYALRFLFKVSATTEVDFERWAQYFLALFIKTAKSLETFVSPVHAYLKFPRACTGKKPFRARFEKHR